MGYTHYYSLKEVSQVAWNKFVEDVKILRKHLPKHSESSGGYFSNEPLFLNGCTQHKTAVINEEKVLFNGGSIPASKRVKVNGEFDIDELAHETFYLDKEHCQKFEFCKTARKPYDLMVQAVILLAQYHFKEKFEFSSDGEKDEWIVANEFIKRVFKIDMDNYLKKL